MKCVLYARVSTDKQAEKQLSIPAQLQAMQEYAQRQGWTVFEEFIESGVSGRTTDRPALQALLGRCATEPRVDVVLVHKIDRLARSVYDHAAIRAQLRRRNIRLASVVENVDDSVSGQLLENILASIGEFYSSNLGEETKKGMRMKVERGGWPFKAPRGYRTTQDGTGKSRVVPTEDAPAIRFAHEQYATGAFSLNELRYLLAERGLKTSAGRVLPLSAIERILKNPFYTGRVRWHGVEHPGTHPAIVPEGLFRRVQTVLSARHRDTGEKGRLHFLLRGLARCAECGGTMTAERHDRWSYYRCVRRAVDRSACSARMCSARVAERSLIQIYQSLLLAPAFKRAVETELEAALKDREQGKASRVRSLSVRRIRLEQREIRLSEAFADGEVSAKAYRSGLTRVRVPLADTCRALRDDAFDPESIRQRARAFLTVAGTLHSLHQRFDERKRHRLLMLVFKSMHLDTSGVRGYALNPPFDTLLQQDDHMGQPGIRAHPEASSVKTAANSLVTYSESLGNPVDIMSEPATPTRISDVPT
jgi:site-specific DNA recombinase